MRFDKLGKNWNDFAKADPLWSILTEDDKKGNRWDEEEFFEKGKKEIDELMKYSRSLNIDVKRGMALDFGCGVGRLTQALADHFEEVHGVDISPRMIELANEHNSHGSRCVYHLNGRSDLQLFDDDVFDFIYSTITLMHMEPKYSMNYIKEFLRVLSPNGLLVFQQPNEVIVYPGDSLIKRMKKKIKADLPKLWYIHRYAWARLFNPDYMNAPLMEVYCVRKREIEKLIRKNRGTLLNVIEDDLRSMPAHRSLRYHVTK
jgi:SAM-dependent methyltransferase